MDKQNAASALIKALLAEGAEVTFGYPGGAILPIYDAIYNLGLRHVLTRHEQGAVHAAEGYAKATGRTGVVFATSGPGATNLTTGLCDAMMDSVPLVAITGQVPRALMGRDSFQEADVLGITMPVTKHNYLVTRAGDLLPTVREAFHLATSGRPGPVLIDIPKDVANEPLAFEYPVPVAPWLLQAEPALDPRLVHQAAELLQSAKRPVVIAGAGVVQSPTGPAMLRMLAERLQLPVVVTLHGLGGFPGNHPLYFGMVGMHGLYAANRAVQMSDLLVAVGMRFDDRVTGRLSQFAPHAKVVHIDRDAAEIGKNVLAHVPLHGDAGILMQALLTAIPANAPVHTAAWYQQVRAWHYQHPVWVERRRQFRAPAELPLPLAQVAVSTMGDSAAAKLPRTEDVLRAVQTVFGPESLLVTDVGQHQMWAAHFCMRSEPRSFVTSGGLGTMGFGLPAAIGAQMARPNKNVVLIAGDGGFQMTMAELGTVAAENLPLKIFIINNGCLGMVRQWQELFYEGRYSAVDLRQGTPDFVRIAEAYGIKAVRVDSVDKLPEVVTAAHAHPGAVLVECQVMPEENVFPMVAPGESNDNMLLGET